MGAGRSQENLLSAKNCQGFIQLPCRQSRHRAQLCFLELWALCLELCNKSRHICGVTSTAQSLACWSTSRSELQGFSFNFAGEFVKYQSIFEKFTNKVRCVCWLICSMWFVGLVVELCWHTFMKVAVKMSDKKHIKWCQNLWTDYES